MLFHTFTQLLDALPEVERITLQGLGEPLLAPNLERMIAHARARVAEVGFNTNGMLLTRESARGLVVSGLSWLHVSLDGAKAETYESIRDGASFERVCENVTGLVEVMRELGADRPRLSMVFVAMRRNVRELPGLVRLVHELGVGRLFVQNLSYSFSDTEPAGSYADIRRFAESEALWSSGDIDVADRARRGALRPGLRLAVHLRVRDAPRRRPALLHGDGCRARRAGQRRGALVRRDLGGRGVRGVPRRPRPGAAAGGLRGLLAVPRRLLRPSARRVAA